MLVWVVKLTRSHLLLLLLWRYLILHMEIVTWTVLSRHLMIRPSCIKRSNLPITLVFITLHSGEVLLWIKAWRWSPSHILHHHCILLSEFWLKLINLLLTNQLWLIVVEWLLLILLRWLVIIEVLGSGRVCIMELRSSICCVATIIFIWVSLLFFHLSVSATQTHSWFDLLFSNDPVVHEIEIKALSHEEISKHWYELLIVRFLFELELSAIVEHLAQLSWKPWSEILDTRNCLLNFDLLILLFFRFCRQTLPWQAPSKEIHQYDANLF